MITAYLPSQEQCLVMGDTGTLELKHPSGSGSFFHTYPFDLLLHRYGKRCEDHSSEPDGNWLQDGSQHSQFLVELQHFVDCVRTGSDPITRGEDGRRVIEVITAAYLSAQEQREVTLPITAEPDFESLFTHMEPRIPKRYRPLGG